MGREAIHLKPLTYWQCLPIRRKVSKFCAEQKTAEGQINKRGVSSQTLSATVWSSMEMPSMEQGFKRAITTILPNNTKYEALLRQVNNIHVLTMVCV